MKNIESNNIKLQSKNYIKLYSLYSKLGGKPFSKYSLLKLYNNLFRVNIEKSRYAFTCGSALDIPIRKFYEIPALGTLLLCVPCKGFNELGFEDGRNCRAIKPSNLYEAIMELEGNSSLAESIASNGRNLVWKSHTASSRALQILMGCNAIKNRKFKGSSWINGEFNLK